MIRLKLLAVLLIVCSGNNDLGDEELFCGTPLLRKDLPEDSELEEPPEARIEAPLDKSKYEPFQILYLPVGEWTQEELKILNDTFTAVNQRLYHVVRGPVLKDVRVGRPYNETSGVCDDVMCHDATVPVQHTLPCKDKAGNLIKDGSETYAPEVQEINKAQKYSVVVYVVSPTIRNVTAKLCGLKEQPVAFASPCRRGKRSRYTHGRLTMCRALNTMTEDHLRHTVLHETFHIVLHSFDGSQFPSNRLVGKTSDPDKLADDAVRTWKWVKRSWKTDETLDSQIEIDVAVTTTKNVIRFVKEHFNCQDIEGAEMAISNWRSGKNTTMLDDLHWNVRLFPDEIMSPIYTPMSRLSNLTLAYIQDSTWYDVDMSLAEPLTVSRPQEHGCAVAQKSCFEVLKNSSASPDKVSTARPYCSTNFRVINPMCSSDNVARLACRIFPGRTYDCGVLRVDNINFTNHPACGFATNLDQRSKEHGLSVGNGTLCITFIDAPWAPNKERLIPGCVAYKCDSDDIILLFRRENAPSCDVRIKKTDENIIIKAHDRFQPDDECAKQFSLIKFIGPSTVHQCTAVTEEPTSIKSAYSKLAENNNKNLALCILISFLYRVVRRLTFI